MSEKVNKKSVLYIKAGTNVILYLLAAILVVIFVPKLFRFFLPFIIGWLISALANPAVKFCEKIKFKRKASSAVMIVLILAVVILIVYGITVFLINQGVGLVESIPEKWSSIQSAMDGVGDGFDKLTKNLPQDLRKPIQNLGSTIKEALGNFVSSLGANSNIAAGISTGIGSVANILVGIIMCVLSAYFFAVEHNTLIDRLEHVLSGNVYAKVHAAYKGLRNAVGGYIKAQVIIEFWVYLITFIGLLILRIDYAVIIALGIAFMDFLPFFGAGIIMVPWSVFLLVNGNYFVGIGMLVTWGVGQLVRQLIQPKIVGDSVGLKPLPTLVLLFIGYKIIGVLGMVIALPVAMIFISLYEEGLFESFVYSVKFLWNGLMEFRKLPKENEEEKNEN